MFLSLVTKVTGQPPDIWHDPNAIGLMTLGVGIAAILVAIGVGIYQVRQGRTRRKLVYQTLSNAPIVSVNSAVADQVEIDIRVKGTLVKDARLLIVNIKNAGKVSLHASDYFEPLTFEFDTKVLQASVLETTPLTLITPSALPAFLILTPQTVQLPAFPLNPGDTIQISILLEGKGSMKARGRLDQGKVVELEPESRSTGNIMEGAAAVVAAGVAVTVAAVIGAIAVSGAVAAVAVVVAAAVVVVVSVVAARRITKQR